MNDLDTLHKDFHAFLVEHHVPETLQWAAHEHPVFCIVGVLGFLTLVCALDIDRDLSTPKVRKPLDPLPKPQPVEPANIVYGAQRQLIQRQRAWMAEAARSQVAAQLDDHTVKATALGFADWFEKSIVIPANTSEDDVIPHNAWVADYHAYCDEHNAARFNDGDLHAHMLSYAHSYHCTLDQQGNYHGGHLKR